MYSVQYVIYDPRTLVEREAGEYGKHPALVRFTGNTISIRRPDGSLVTTGTPRTLSSKDLGQLYIAKLGIRCG